MCFALIENFLRSSDVLSESRFGPEGTLCMGSFNGDFRVSILRPGMSAERRQRAFDRFYRASGSDGAGLGLAMVQRVAQLHRGGVAIIDGLDGAGVGVEAWLR